MLNRFSHDGTERAASSRAAKQAFAFAWDKAQEHLWPFFVFAAAWAGLYALFALVIFFSPRPFVGVLARGVAGLGAMAFVLWFSYVTLDIAKGKRADIGTMARAFSVFADWLLLVRAFLSFVIVGVIALPGLVVMALATSLPFIAPAFAVALVVVSWLYIIAVIALHANVGFMLVGTSSAVRSPKGISVSYLRELGATAVKTASESRAFTEKNAGAYARVWLYGALLFAAGLVPSILTLGAGSVFLVFMFGVVLARMYVGTHRVSVPVSQI